jgi:hypothetical protein
MRLPWSPQSVAVGASAAAASDAGAGEKSSGRLGEVFVSTNKIGSAADAIARVGGTMSLFAEMDTIAAKLRAHPQFVQRDLQIAFYQLQRDRIGNLSREGWLYLFGVWRDHDRGQQVIDGAERDARFDVLCDERDLLFSARERYPEHRAALTARLYQIGTELAELMPKFPAAPLGDWVNSSSRAAP